jgi:chromate transporter
MHHEIVDRREWLSEKQFLDALAFCQVIPGPEAQQLATYIGWRMHGLRGGLVAGGLFILPGAIFMMVLAGLYVAGADTEVVRTIFQVVRPLVVVIVALALVRLGRRALRGWLDLSLAAGAFVSLFFFHLPFPLVVLGAGLIGAARSTGVSVVGAPEQPAPGPSLRVLGAGVLLWWLPPLVLLLLLGGGSALVQLGLFLGRVALVTFGGAYAILSYVQVQAVERFHWLTPAEMLDGLGLAETTPGPLILVLQFVGFLTGHRSGGPFDPWIGGAVGGLIALWASFVPSFTFVLAGAPYIEWIRGMPRLQAAFGGVSAAVVGVILNLTVTLAGQAIEQPTNRLTN